MRATVLLAVMAFAVPATATEVVRLSDAQRDAVIAAAANGPERNPVLTPEQAPHPSVLNRSLYPEFWPEFWGDDATPDRRVHGEISMFAGSGGTFGMSGTAVMPVGSTGTAAISLMRGTSNWGGLQGFSLGYASDGGIIGGGGNGGFGAFGGPGPWGNPWIAGPIQRRQAGGRIR